MKKINILKNNGLIMIVLFTTSIFGQTKQNLSKQLWERAQSCYSQFEGNDDDGKLDGVEIIDDAKNGYLKISGIIGTCGCSCSKTIAAFKGKNGNYTFLEQEISDCSWLHKVSSNRNLKELLPKGFGIQSFIPNLKDTSTKEAVFYLDVAIPRHGTDTQVTLKIIPFGMHIKSDSLLIYNFSEYDKRANLKEAHNIQQALLILSDKGIEYIYKNKQCKLTESDIKILNRYELNEDKKVINMFHDELHKLKNIYDVYSKIEQQSILLKWDKNKARFIIKEKGNHIEPISFYKFLRSDFLKYWMATC